jgi:outer membrane protein assembly factor BamB
VAPGQLGVFYSSAVFPPPTPGQTVTLPSGFKLAALRAEDGTRVWSTTLTQAFVGPIVASGTVYGSMVERPSAGTPGQTTLAALRGSDGGQLWNRTTAALTLAVGADSSALYAVGYPSQGPAADTPLLALRPSDGSQLWTADLGGLLQGGPTQPIVESNGLLYFVAGSAPQAGGSGPQYKVVALRASDGKQQWSASLTPPLSDRITSFTLAGDTLYVAGGSVPPTSSNIPEVPTIVALRASDGGQLWTHQFTTPLPTGQISLVAGASGVFATVMLQPQGSSGAQGGMLAGLNPQTGAQFWSATLAGPALSLVADANAVYAATGLPGTPSPNSIAAYKASDGTPLWSQPVQDGAPTVLADASGSLIASVSAPPGPNTGGGTGTAAIEALRASDGSLQWKVEADGLGTVSVAPF